MLRTYQIQIPNKSTDTSSVYWFKLFGCFLTIIILTLVICIEMTSVREGGRSHYNMSMFFAPFATPPKKMFFFGTSDTFCSVNHCRLVNRAIFTPSHPWSTVRENIYFIKYSFFKELSSSCIIILSTMKKNILNLRIACILCFFINLIKPFQRRSIVNNNI